MSKYLSKNNEMYSYICFFIIVFWCIIFFTNMFIDNNRIEFTANCNASIIDYAYSIEKLEKICKENNNKSLAGYEVYKECVEGLTYKTYWITKPCIIISNLSDIIYKTENHCLIKNKLKGDSKPFKLARGICV